MTPEALISMSHQNPILFFDGECLLCQSSVQFLLTRDRNQQFRYAYLQGKSFDDLRNYLSINEIPDSVVMLNNGRLYFQSDAVLASLKYLNFPYPIFAKVIMWIPSKLRNLIYNYIGKNRYKWFGKSDNCMIPSPEIKPLFIDDELVTV